MARVEQRIRLVKGDITQLEVDAIVNAANSRLAGGGGVDGAIHRAGGPAIMEACREIGGCPTGEAVLTTGGDLSAEMVIHTVGPIWKDGLQNEASLLEKCYVNSLHLARKHTLRTIAFPNISTGVYGYPKEEAAEIAITTTKNFLAEYFDIQEVFFVCFDDENYQLYKERL
ncbi:O-acetyl-ADP-ribose deacetylase [Bacillus tianshenii]|nr:O-acetyl-ADP-ribose deacetylase [Bacillus tianshenii]